MTSRLEARRKIKEQLKKHPGFSPDAKQATIIKEYKTYYNRLLNEYKKQYGKAELLPLTFKTRQKDSEYRVIVKKFKYIENIPGKENSQYIDILKKVISDYLKSKIYTLKGTDKAKYKKTIQLHSIKILKKLAEIGGLNVNLIKEGEIIIIKNGILRVSNRYFSLETGRESALAERRFNTLRTSIQQRRQLQRTQVAPQQSLEKLYGQLDEMNKHLVVEKASLTVIDDTPTPQRIQIQTIQRQQRQKPRINTQNKPPKKRKPRKQPIKINRLGAKPPKPPKPTGAPIQLPGVTPKPPKPAGAPIQLPGVTPKPPKPAGAPIQLPGVTPKPPKPAGAPIQLPGVTPKPPKPAGAPIQLPGVTPKPSQGIHTPLLKRKVQKGQVLTLLKKKKISQGAALQLLKPSANTGTVLNLLKQKKISHGAALELLKKQKVAGMVLNLLKKKKISQGAALQLLKPKTNTGAVLNLLQQKKINQGAALQLLRKPQKGQVLTLLKQGKINKGTALELLKKQKVVGTVLKLLEKKKISQGAALTLLKTQNKGTILTLLKKKKISHGAALELLQTKRSEGAALQLLKGEKISTGSALELLKATEVKTGSILKLLTQKKISQGAALTLLKPIKINQGAALKLIKKRIDKGSLLKLIIQKKLSTGKALKLLTGKPNKGAVLNLWKSGKIKNGTILNLLTDKASGKPLSLLSIGSNPKLNTGSPAKLNTGSGTQLNSGNATKLNKGKQSNLLGGKQTNLLGGKPANLLPPKKSKVRKGKETKLLGTNSAPGTMTNPQTEKIYKKYEKYFKNYAANPVQSMRKYLIPHLISSTKKEVTPAIIETNLKKLQENLNKLMECKKMSHLRKKTKSEILKIYFNDQGIKIQTGKPFNQITVPHLLKNKTAILKFLAKHKKFETKIHSIEKSLKEETKNNKTSLSINYSLPNSGPIHTHTISVTINATFNKTKIKSKPHTITAASINTNNKGLEKKLIQHTDLFIKVVQTAKQLQKKQFKEVNPASTIDIQKIKNSPELQFNVSTKSKKYIITINIKQNEITKIKRTVAPYEEAVLLDVGKRLLSQTKTPAETEKLIETIFKANKTKLKFRRKLQTLDPGIQRKIKKLDPGIRRKVTMLPAPIIRRVIKLNPGKIQKITQLDPNQIIKITQKLSGLDDQITYHPLFQNYPFTVQKKEVKSGKTHLKFTFKVNGKDVVFDQKDKTAAIKSYLDVAHGKIETLKKMLAVKSISMKTPINIIKQPINATTLAQLTAFEKSIKASEKSMHGWSDKPAKISAQYSYAHPNHSFTLTFDSTEPHSITKMSIKPLKLTGTSLTYLKHELDHATNVLVFIYASLSSFKTNFDRFEMPQLDIKKHLNNNNEMKIDTISVQASIGSNQYQLTLKPSTTGNTPEKIIQNNRRHAIKSIKKGSVEITPSHDDRLRLSAIKNPTETAKFIEKLITKERHKKYAETILNDTKLKKLPQIAKSLEKALKLKNKSISFNKNIRNYFTLFRLHKKKNTLTFLFEKIESELQKGNLKNTTSIKINYFQTTSGGMLTINNKQIKMTDQRLKEIIPNKFKEESHHETIDSWVRSQINSQLLKQNKNFPLNSIQYPQIAIQTQSKGADFMNLNTQGIRKTYKTIEQYITQLMNSDTFKKAKTPQKITQIKALGHIVVRNTNNGHSLIVGHEKKKYSRTLDNHIEVDL